MMYFYSKLFVSVYDDNDDAAAAAAKAAADAAAKAAEDAAAEALKNKKTFTQEELNTIVSKERRTYEEKTKQTISELEKLQKSKTLSEQDKTNLSKRIEELNNELLTKEQLAAKEREKLKKQHEDEKSQVLQERDLWSQRYRSSEINRAIVDAAISEGAFDSSQISALLVPNAALVEDADNEGKGLGTFTAKVKFKDKDKEGKPVTLDLTMPEAVKRMKDDPEKFGNLFKSTANGGLGITGGGASSKTQTDLKNMNQTQWREYRKKSGLANAGK